MNQKGIMTRLLMIVSSAREMDVVDGTHPTGYWAEEVLKPFDRFEDAGVEITVATPDGKAGQPDPWSLAPYFQFPDDEEDFMLSVFRSFSRHAEDTRVTLHQLTDLNLIAARRVHQALVAAGMDPGEARTRVEARGKTAYTDDVDFIDVLAADAEVTDLVPAAALRDLAIEVWYESESESTRIRERLGSLAQFQNPRDLREVTDTEIDTFDGVFIPGGHGPMVDLHDNADMRRVLQRTHQRGATIAALCHGPAALLSAGEGVDGAWLFDGYKMTAFTDEEEDQTQAARHGMTWYLEGALKSAGAIFDDADAAWSSHVIIDRNLITAQNPASSEAAADAVLKRLEVL
jgi:putative intracellular protease/amidase